jgi:hypothetical protein
MLYSLGFLGEGVESFEDFSLQEVVLVGLFSEDLLAFLATSDEIWHNHFSWTVRKVLVDEEAFVG